MPLKLPTGIWLQSKLDRLVNLTEIVVKENPEQYSESDPQYGFWSVKKEIALMYWIWPFLKIAKNYFSSFYYIDLFAGSGLMKTDNIFFVGSPMVAVGSTLQEEKFSQYLCLEADASRKESLQRRMDDVYERFGNFNVQIIKADCNQELESVLNKYCNMPNSCYLAFVTLKKYQI